MVKPMAVKRPAFQFKIYIYKDPNNGCVSVYIYIYIV